MPAVEDIVTVHTLNVMDDGPSKSGDEPHGIYEPLQPPYQILSDTNRGPVALVTATTLIIITSLTVSIKVYTMFATTRKLGFNDLSMIGSMVLFAESLWESTV